MATTGLLNYNVYRNFLKYQETVKELKKELDRDPTDSEIKQVLPKANIELMKNLEIEEENDDELQFRLSVINRRLRKARLKKGLKQQDVSEKLGKSSSWYGQRESCYIHPTKKEQQQIAELFEQDVDYLFPEWLEVFTNKWKRQDRAKTLSYKTITLDSPEALMIEGSELESVAKKAIAKKKIKEALSEGTLSIREEKILEMRFGLKDGVTHTWEEVGKEFDVTRGRICQIEAKAFERLQNTEALKNYCSDYEPDL